MSVQLCAHVSATFPLLLSPPRRFGFYKYMKMDEEEEDPRRRAFLFLNSDSKQPSHAQPTPFAPVHRASLSCHPLAGMVLHGLARPGSVLRRWSPGC